VTASHGNASSNIANAQYESLEVLVLTVSHGRAVVRPRRRAAAPSWAANTARPPGSAVVSVSEVVPRPGLEPG
jgi:hypothetical protein